MIRRSPVWADAIETLVALGEIERARAYLERYEANAKRLGKPLGQPPPRAVAACSALPRET